MKNLVIEINKDIDRYKETVVMGLTARQLIFSIASVATGGGIVLFLYQYVGLTVSVYVAIPAVAPIALGGFYSFHEMGFYEVMRRKMQMIFANRPLTYVSAEGETVIRQHRIEPEAKEVYNKATQKNNFKINIFRLFPGKKQIKKKSKESSKYHG